MGSAIHGGPRIDGIRPWRPFRASASAGGRQTLEEASGSGGIVARRGDATMQDGLRRCRMQLGTADGGTPGGGAEGLALDRASLHVYRHRRLGQSFLFFSL